MAPLASARRLRIQSFPNSTTRAVGDAGLRITKDHPSVLRCMCGDCAHGVACGGRGGGGWHKASVSDCLPLAAPIGLSLLLILTLCGPERVGGWGGKQPQHHSHQATGTHPHPHGGAPQ